jgi:hypothetical protein
VQIAALETILRPQADGDRELVAAVAETSRGVFRRFRVAPAAG